MHIHKLIRPSVWADDELSRPPPALS